MIALPARVDRALAALGVGPDDPIGVACSGGADSIALLHLVARRPVTALHVDHRMRDDSSSDADFVRDAAAALRRPFAMRTLAVRPSDEASARDARYTALDEMAREHELRWVLTAHTRDDQAETVLLRLMRGDPLDAIAPVRGNVVRPLLDVSRAELREWLAANAIAWREDPSNDDRRIERNWVRHVLLPQIAERRPGVTSTLARAARRSRDDAIALDAIAASIVSRAASDDVGVFVADLRALPPAVLARVIRTGCRQLGHDPSTRDVDAALATGSHVRTGPVDLWRMDDGLAFVRSPMPVPDPVGVVGPEFSSARWGVTVRVAPDANGLCIRTRRPGDRVFTAAGSRKVQDVLVDAKVPRPLRPLVPILADGDGAVTVVSGRLRCASLVGAEPYEQTWSRQRAWIR